MKSLSFGNKLLLLVLSTVILVFGLTISFVTYFSFETAENDAKSYIKEVAHKNALKIQAKVNESIIISKVMAYKYTNALETSTPLKEEEIIEFISDILMDNPFIVGFWFKIKEKELFFKEGSPNDSRKWYDKTGQFNPYIAKSGSKITINPGSPYGTNLEWVKGPMESGKVYVTKPYMYPVDGVDVLMSTVAVPMYNNGEFIGSIGIDITMETFSQMAKEIKLYDNGYVFMVDHHDFIIGHPTEDYVGKTIPVITNNSKEHINLLNNTRNKQDTLFFKNSIKDDIKSLYYSKAIKIGTDDIHWSFVLVAPVNEYLANANFIMYFSIIAGFVALIVIALIIYLVVRKLNKNLDSISTGLNEFFMFLNRKAEHPNKIEVTSKDEFGVMANSINENVEIITNNVKVDHQLINDVKSVVNHVKEGYLEKRIHTNSSTPSLNELKELLNEMLSNLEKAVGKDINLLNDTLSKYTQRDFTARLDLKTSGVIGGEVIQMNRMITHMLQTSQKDGEELRLSSEELTQNMLTLSSNASSQAASLEETAASIDEITSNIEQTSQKAQSMLKISNDTKISATEGKKLANDTVNAMDEINETVININEAISVIDQIAFQTNILSLNAAVEAATAGEAGKGFAVVAGEVRNLASRSAEAANEIKTLVENATNRTNNGKHISNKMIEGFSLLEEKIVDTSKLIDDVTNAAKEQSVGMNQIADAVGQLDQFTQENAAVADKTNGIAQQTKAIALEVVNNVDKNVFDGKGKSYQEKEHKHENNYQERKIQTRVNTNKDYSDDSWESF